MAIDYGTDVSTWGPDGKIRLDLNGPEISGVQVPLEHAARCITTPRRAIFFAQQLGVVRPLQSLVNSNLDDADLVRIAGEWGAAVKEQVENVAGARFFLRRTSDDKGITFTGTLMTEDGVFQFKGTAGEVFAVFFPTVTQ